MTTKTKIRLSVAIAVIAVIMTVVAIVGICLASNKSYTFNGEVSFTSSDIKATITEANISGASVGDDKMQPIEVDGLITESENFDSWKGLDFKLGKDSNDIEIRFNIINHSVDKTLKIDLGQIQAQLTNASMSIKFDGMDADTLTTYVARARTDQQGIVIEESFKQIIITLHVNQRNKDASINDFNIPIVFQNVDGYVVNLSSQSVEVDASTVVYTDIDSTEIKFDNTLELCGNMITIINKTEYDFNYRFVFNNGTPNSYIIKAGKQIVLAFDKDSNVVITSIIKSY